MGIPGIPEVPVFPGIPGIQRKSIQKKDTQKGVSTRLMTIMFCLR